MSSNPSIVVRFATNVRDFLSGTRQVEQAFADLEAESGDLARAAEADTERMERAFRDAGRKIEATADRTGREAGRDFRKATGAAGAEAGRETASEFSQNLGESLASGNLEDIGADTAGGLISGFASMGGPIGTALAAAAIPVTAWFAERRKEAEEFRETVRTLFDVYRSESETLEADLREARLDKFFESLGTDAAVVFEALRAYGVSEETIARAVQGDTEAVEELRTATLKAREAADQTAAGYVGIGRGLNQLGNAVGLDSLFPEEDAVNRLDRAADAAERLARADRDALESARLRSRLGLISSGAYLGSYSTSADRPGGGRRD